MKSPNNRSWLIIHCSLHDVRGILTPWEDTRRTLHSNSMGGHWSRKGTFPLLLQSHFRRAPGKKCYFMELWNICTWVWWMICASYNLSSFRFVGAKRRQDDKTKSRQDDKTKSRQDDKIKAKRRQTQPAN